MFIRYRVLIKIILDKDLKIYNSILGSIISGIRGLRGNINSILPINRRLNRETKLNVRTVFKALY